SVGREYIGRVFAICVLGGLGSLPGTVIGAMLLGIIESFTATFYGPSWAPAVAFGVLLLTLAFRPAGLLGRYVSARANASLFLDFDRGRSCRVFRCATGEQRLRVLRRLHRVAIRGTGDRLEYSRRIYRLRQFRLGRVLRAGRLCDGLPAQIVSIADP